MIVPDTNLLLYAHNSNSRYHESAAGWFKRTFGGEQTVGLLPVVVFGFVRIITNPRVYEEPLRATEAANLVRTWLAYPAVELLPPDHKHVTRVLVLLEDSGTMGNLVADAQIAAACIESDATLHTSDSDFVRFRPLKWFNPLTNLGGGPSK